MAQQHKLAKNITVELDDNITYRTMLQSQSAGKTSSQILRDLVLRFVSFKQANGEFVKISQHQYDRLPLFIGRALDKWMNELFLVKADVDTQDRFLVTLPSGRKARYRVPLTSDQLNAEKWAMKQPEMLTAYIMESVFTFENANGEFEPMTVEDIVEFTIQDGYAMSEIITAEEDCDVFFLGLSGEESESTSSDSSTTDSASRKSRR